MLKRLFPPAVVILTLLMAPAPASWCAGEPGAVPPGRHLSQAATPAPAETAPEGDQTAGESAPVPEPAEQPAATAAPPPPAVPAPKAAAPQPPPPAAVKPPSPAPVPGRPPQQITPAPKAAAPQPPPAAARPAAPPVGPAPPPPRAAVAAPPAVGGGKVALNFDDADVFSLIQTIFGEVLRVNYVIDPRVKGRVNFRSVAPVDRDKVLPVMEVILRLNGIGVVEESGLYRIVPISDISREPSPVGFGREPEKIKITGKALLQVIPIRYVSSGEVVKLITPFLSPNAVVVDVPRSNHVIVVDTDASVKRIVEIVKIIDSEGLNVLVVMSTAEEYEIILETIRKVDIAPRQVVVEGIIAQVDLTDDMSLGLAGYFKMQVGDLDGKFGLNMSSLKTDPLSTSGFTFVGTDASGAVRVLVNALASESKAKLLATPHIIVSDNKEARIQVGKSVPLVTSETYGTVGVAPQRIVQYKDIGVILKVKPRVNESGLVSIELTQEVSNYTTEKLYVDSTEIILNKAEATTSLVVQDGQTIVIGGLIREDAGRSRIGLPFLTKIPLLGWLFGSTDDTYARTELIILLSPHVIKDQQAAADITSDYVEDMTRGREKLIKKEELIREKKPQAPKAP